MIGLVTYNDETAYRREVENLALWCQENNLSLNVSKTKEIIVDFRINKTAHTPITINGAPIEIVDSFKFLGVNITHKLTWSVNTKSILKKLSKDYSF